VAKADVLVERTPFQREKEEMEHVEVRENETKGQPK
jgi:hypothetical protein